MKVLSARFAVLAALSAMLIPMLRAEPTIEEVEARFIELQIQMMEIRNQMEVLQTQLVIIPIRTSGGFLQFGVRIAEPVRLHVGYGFDNPNDSDLVADEFYRRSTTLFGNAYFDLTSDLSVVVEGTRVETTWSDGIRDGFRFQSSLIFIW